MSEATQPKKRRSYGPKSKFGCKTCRTRRYKCDETKPRCLRCTKDGFECEGFPVKPAAPGSAYGRQILPRDHQNVVVSSSNTQLSKRAAPPGILIKPRTAVFEHNLEYQYFTEFRERTVADIAGYYDRDVWDRLVPQICHQEASIRHLTVALAAVNMTITTITDPSDSTKSLDTRRKEAWRHTAFGLRHYAKGLALMRRLTFADLGDEYQLRNALLSCFITMTFEFYQGNKEAAIKQAAAGIDLLNNFHHRRFGTWPTNIADIPSTATIDSDIIATFAHLQTLLSLGQRKDGSANSPNEEDSKKFLDQIPSQFLDLDSARFSWVLNSSVYRKGDRNQSKGEFDFLYDVVNPRFEIEDMPLITSIPVKQETSREGTPMSASPDPETKTEGRSRWMKAFQPLYDRCRSKPPSSPDYQHATILMILYISNKLKVADSNLNLDHDFLAESLQLMPLAKDLLALRAEDEDKTLLQITRFLDEGVMAGLFLVAIRCQDRVVRREAIRLLESLPGKEWHLDSILAAKIAAWFIEKEEQAVNEESSLVSRFVIEYIYRLPERTVSICLSKQLKNETNRILTPPVTLSW